jgi:hypothetical protein
MNIVTNNPCIVKLPNGSCCNKGYEAKLNRGQLVELALVEHLRQFMPRYEINVYEGNRQFLNNYDPKYFQALARGCKPRRELTVNPKIRLGCLDDRWGHWMKMYTLFQRDIYCQLPGKTIDIEVKSRNLRGFSFPTVYIGKTKGWQERRFKPDIFVVIDDSTGEARYIDIQQTRLDGLWNIVEASEEHHNDQCYEVPLEAFRPLSDLIETLLSLGVALELGYKKLPK